jgi:rRNA maturation endonuclease Nob1
MNITGREKIVVSDTNVFIDLISLELMEVFFRLGYQVHTPALVVHEIDDPPQEKMIRHFVEDGQLHVDFPDESQLREAVDFFQSTRKLSLPDCAVMELAKRIGGKILSSDRSMKEESNKRNIRLNGLLVVISEMVKVELITRNEGISKLEMLTLKNGRAPKKECYALIEMWRT